MSNQIGYQWKPTTNTIVQQKRQDFSKNNSEDKNGISLCIRFAFKNISPGRVFAIMKNPTVESNGQKTTCSFGFIERIDHICRQDGNKTYFIHFKPNTWNFNQSAATDALNEMKTGKEIKIINDDNGHYWKVSISKAQRPEDADTPITKPKVPKTAVFPETQFTISSVNFPEISREVNSEISRLKHVTFSEEKQAE
jgi:hypothetical protein